MVLLQLLLVQLLLWVCRTMAAPSMVLPGCPEKCGNVAIPYPFGFQTGCYRDDQGFNITCNHTFNPPKPYFYNLEILQLTASPPEMRLQNWVAYTCYNETGQMTRQRQPTAIGLGDVTSPYTFSDQNQFTAVGCDTVGVIQGSVDGDFVTGCLSICMNREQVSNNSCSGVGCCETQIPGGSKRFDFVLASVYNHTNATFNPCSYGFLAGKDRYNFSLVDLTDPLTSFLDRTTRNVPVVIDWAIGNESCAVAQRNSSSNYPCGANTTCSDAINRGGYLCKCKDGYEGNPYLPLPAGCEDVNECADPKANNCVENACVNNNGSYSCSCPDGLSGDGRKNGTGCTKANKALSVTKVIIGIGVGLLFLIVFSSWSYWALKKRRLMKLKEKFFKQNGGMLLQQQLSTHEGITETTKIFSVEELERATDNFNDNRVIGKGGYGTVYRGILSDQRVVAVKKSKLVDETQIEQFINEASILTQINHRNVVKLLGCCLETEVPFLVYEFISNGTLFQHIHGDNRSSISWDNRLRIAAETAEALAYLHSSASIPIFHRDVKSTNILLDDNYTAKVSDFGASRLVPMDKTQVTTLVQGTLGYLDPEYLQTSQLTDKSDVYSFGVVLVELLTGQLPLSFHRPEDERNLSMHFLSLMKNNHLLEILETRVVDEGTVEQLEAVAELAQRCLRVKGEERPTMKEIASELQGLRRLGKHPWVLQNNEEAESLLGEASDCFRDNTIGYDSLRNQGPLALEMPR